MPKKLLNYPIILLFCYTIANLSSAAEIEFESFQYISSIVDSSGKPLPLGLDATLKCDHKCFNDELQIAASDFPRDPYLNDLYSVGGRLVQFIETGYDGLQSWSVNLERELSDQTETSKPYFASNSQAANDSVNTIYVDKQIGRNRCSDYDPATRLCSAGRFRAYSEITAAAKVVEAGESVLIQPGRYSGGVVVETSAKELQPITFRAVTAGVVIEGSGNARDAFFIDHADYIIIDGLTIQNAKRAAMRISLSDHVTVRNSTFADNDSWGLFTDFSNYTIVENSEAYGSIRQHGIYISNSSDYPIIRGNRIHHNGGAGLHMNGDIEMGGDGIVSGALIENNTIYENGSLGASAINLDGVTDSIVRNNLLYENHASGISLYQIDGGDESQGNQVLNNTIVMASDARWALNMPNTENNKVFNNIILNKHRTRGSIIVRTPISPRFESDFNIIMDRFEIEERDGTSLNLEQWQALGYDQHSLLAPASALFVDVGNSNFELSDSSPALDKGMQLEDVATDLNGRIRPGGSGFDIGALER